MKRKVLVAVTVAVIVVAVGMGVKVLRGRSEEGWDTKDTRVLVDRRLVDGHTEFAFKLLKELRKVDPKRNVVICPASIAIALAMTRNGTAGATNREIADALGVSKMSEADFDAANSALMSNLSGLGVGAELKFANALWWRNGVTLKPDFMKTCETSYGAKLASLDFNSSSAVNTINSWVRDQTKGKIDGIVDRIEPRGFAILTNTAYFRGKWTEPFDRKLTENAPFHLLDGTTKSIPMMYNQEAKGKFFETESFAAADLTYGSGRVSMIIFVPTEKSNLDKFCKELDASNWRKWMKPESCLEEGSITLPRFRSRHDAELIDVLKALGIRTAFEPGSADLTRMCELKPAWVSQARHKVYVDVNEERTEAAAATEEAVAASTGGSLVADRPFFFAIRDNPTGEILFAGFIVDPTQE